MKNEVGGRRDLRLVTRFVWRVTHCWAMAGSLLKVRVRP